MEIAIIGFGPWGLSVLERLVDRTDEAGVAVRVHIVDPARSAVASTASTSLITWS